MKTQAILFAWMFAMIVAGSASATEPQSSSPTAENGNPAGRSLTAIGLDVHAALRAEALSRRQGPNGADVNRLVDLYRELAAHPKRDESAVAWDLGISLRSRLEEVRERIERRNGEAERFAKKKRDGDVVARAVPDQDGPAMLKTENQVLAQQGALPRGAAQGPPGVVAQPSAAQINAGQTADYGPQLVDLIQRTISPGTWDINGGKGSIVYYPPLQVLVVRAPGTVQGQIGGVLGQVRAIR